MRERESDRSVASVMKFTGILMATIYVAIGIAILSQSISFLNIPSRISVPLGSVMIAYGLFRAFRIYQNQQMNRR